jgi:hypothetical protein
VSLGASGFGRLFRERLAPFGHSANEADERADAPAGRIPRSVAGAYAACVNTAFRQPDQNFFNERGMKGTIVTHESSLRESRSDIQWAAAVRSSGGWASSHGHRPAAGNPKPRRSSRRPGFRTSLRERVCPGSRQGSCQKGGPKPPRVSNLRRGLSRNSEDCPLLTLGSAGGFSEATKGAASIDPPANGKLGNGPGKGYRWKNSVVATAEP